MAKLFAVLIINKRKTIKDVPAKLKDKVIEELWLRGYDENGDPLVEEEDNEQG